MKSRIGNIVGSNIFNVFYILGVSSFAMPLPFAPQLNADVAVMTGATFLLFFAMFFGKPQASSTALRGGGYSFCYTLCMLPG